MSVLVVVLFVCCGCALYELSCVVCSRCDCVVCVVFVVCSWCVRVCVCVAMLLWL